MRRNKAFTILELLVVIGIIAVLLAILLPAMEKARENANVLKCAANLHTLGQSLSMYSNDNHGNYPRTVYVKGAPPTAGTQAAAPNAFGTGGPAANDVSAAVFLLMRAQSIPPIVLICPYNDVNEWIPDPAPDLLSRSNFTDYRHNLGYSYANPYPDDHAEGTGYRLNNQLSAITPVMADLNPGTGNSDNSKNHEDRGQNVLYADGHVTWEASPLVGVDKDNIYTTKTGSVAASPLDVTDTILLPSQQ